MSKYLNLPRNKPESTKTSPYKQKLQTNLPNYDVSLNVLKPVTQSASRVKKTENSINTSNKNKVSTSKDDCDSLDNDATGNRPEVLSIDSDFDSGNGLTESPDQDHQPFTTKTLISKIQYEGDNDLKTPECNPSWVSNRRNQNNISYNVSYYTPPSHMTTAKSRVHLEKKGLSSDQERKRESFSIIPPDHITTGHNREVKEVYGRSEVYALNKAAIPVIIGRSQECLSPKSSSDCQINKRSSDSDHVGQEEMDMKFADLTHMQLKRSLDQIHGLDSARSSSVTNLIYSSVPSVGNTCYSHELDVKNDLLKPWRHNSAGNFYQHGTATTTFENGHTVSSQSNKFDAVLQVKDAMLQEKESVILKLRLQVAALQHHMKEGDAALRQVMTSHYTTVSKSSSSSLGKTVNIEAQKRIHDLDRMLGKVESDLEETKSQYAREKTHHEDRIKNLEAYLKLRDQSISDWKNKYRACNDRMEKYKKRVESLERYLGGLPTVEESNKLKTEADILGVERENMIVEINNLKDKLEITNKLCKERELEEVQKKENEIKALQEIADLKEMVSKLEKSKLELGTSERDHLEELEYEVARLKKEKEDSVKLLSSTEHRMKQMVGSHHIEMENLHEQVLENEETIETLRKDMLMKQQTANKVHTAMMNLSSQNQLLMEQKLTLQDKVKALEKVQGNFKEEAAACARLQRETFSAVHDLKAVTHVLIQTAKGNDPNLSALLGISSEVHVDQAFDKTDVGQTNKKISEVRNLRKEVDDLRTMISNRYAENIGDNCTTH